MKNNIIGILIVVCIFSCGKNNTEKLKNSNRSDKKIDSLFNPNEFIGEHKAKAMVLGVFHFNNPGLDSYKEKFEIDIFSDKRQKELEILIKQLAEFKPTKIFVERFRKDDSLYNNHFTKYLNDTYNLNSIRNEQYQIGFRLAKKLGHKKLYAADTKSKWFGADIDWNNYDSDEYQKTLGQYEKANRYDYEKIYRIEDSLKSVQTLIEHFKFLNSPENSLKSHQQYLTNVVLTGAGDLYIGADNLTRWYQRNLKIFANIYDITDFEKEERLLIIYGSGHNWQLRQFLTDSPDYEYIEVNEYLE